VRPGKVNFTSEVVTPVLRMIVGSTGWSGEGSRYVGGRGVETCETGRIETDEEVEVTCLHDGKTTTRGESYRGHGKGDGFQWKGRLSAREGENREKTR